MHLTWGAVVLALSLTIGALATEAQQVGKVWRIGYLSAYPRTPGMPFQLDVLLHRLRELGYVEGKNLVVEARFSEGRAGRGPALAAELAAAKVDLILALGNWGAAAAKQATATIPIVTLGGVDPVRAGLVASLARPGGNVTGLVQDIQHTVLIKQLELLRELVPRNSRIAVVRSGLGGSRQSCRTLRRQDLEGREACRPAHRTAHQVRVGDQPQDREGSGPYDPAVVAAQGGSRHRVKR
jgi:hypothetical protein